jgi:RimJ/RimL family protein N-acetyltransferase
MTVTPAMTAERTNDTPRLRLRPQVADDIDAFAELLGDAEAARFIGGQQPREGAWRSLACMAGSWQLQGYAMFSVVEKATGRCIGRVGPWQPLGWPGTEVGWGLVRSAWGKGYAMESAIAAIDWAFDHLHWNEVIHCIDPANVPSQRLARRLGSTLRGPGRLPAPFEQAPVEIWGQTREQWRARTTR